VKSKDCSKKLSWNPNDDQRHLGPFLFVRLYCISLVLPCEQELAAAWVGAKRVDVGAIMVMSRGYNVRT
jgi:hypothetical protein